MAIFHCYISSPEGMNANFFRRFQQFSSKQNLRVPDVPGLRSLGSFSEADVAEDKAAIIQEEAGAVEGTMNTRHQQANISQPQLCGRTHLIIVLV